MKINVLVRFLTVVSLLFSMHSFALPEISPYQGLVLAKDSNEAQLKEKALEQVLIKVSGNLDINKLDDSKLLVKDMDSLLAQFGYQDIDNQRYYFALFEQNKIDNALITMQQPLWGKIRPATLIWLVNENKQLTSENMLNDKQLNSLAAGVDKAQIERGVVADFPLVDLDDSIAVSVSDVSGRFYQTVAAASVRYDAEYFVVANLTNIDSEQWQLKWELVHYTSSNKKSQVVLKQSSVGNQAEVMSSMLDEIADYYAKQFALLQSEGEKSTQLVSVTNIHSLNNIMQLSDILNSLNAIESFEIISVNDNKVELLVSLKGGVNSLKNALNIQPQLQKDLISNSPFNYNWQP